MEIPFHSLILTPNRIIPAPEVAIADRLENVYACVFIYKCACMYVCICTYGESPQTGIIFWGRPLAGQSSPS